LAIEEINRPVPLVQTPTPTTFLTRTFTPTATHTPTFTPLPTFTPTPTLTPTPYFQVDAGTPLPGFSQSITLGTAGQLSALAEWKEETVSDLDWTPDGALLVVASNAHINFYEPETRQLLRTLYPTKEGIIDIVFSPGGTWLVAGSRQGDEKSGYSSFLDLWVGPNWKPLGLLYGVVAGLTSMSFLPDGQILAVAYAAPGYAGKNYIDFWASPSWIINTSMDTDILQEVAFSPDGRFFVTTPDRYAIQVWDLIEKELLYTIPTSFTGAVNRFAFSPAGDFLATGHHDGKVRVWDLNTGELMLEFDTGAVVQSIAYSSDSEIIATGGSFENSRIQLWATGSGDLLRSIDNDTSGISSLIFSPNQRFLVSGSYDGTIRVWGIRP
jgi:WD40 repeat protein